MVTWASERCLRSRNRGVNTSSPNVSQSKKPNCISLLRACLQFVHNKEVGKKLTKLIKELPHNGFPDEGKNYNLHSVRDVQDALTTAQSVISARGELKQTTRHCFNCRIDAIKEEL